MSERSVRMTFCGRPRWRSSPSVGSVLRLGHWSGQKQTAVLKKIEQRGRPLADLAEIAITGVKTGMNRVFAFDIIEDRGQTLIVMGEGSEEKVELERRFVRPYCKAESMKRYAFAPRERALLYPYRLDGDTTALVPEAELRETCPLTYQHLVRHKPALERRESGKLAGQSWYGLSFASDLHMFNGPKLTTPTCPPCRARDPAAAQGDDRPRRVTIGRTRCIAVGVGDNEGGFGNPVSRWRQ
jgi:hypothetical protein